MSNLSVARLVLGLRSTAQSLGIIGRDTGIFAHHGIALQIIREETAGPAGARYLISGESDLGEFGAVPVIQAVLEGADPVIVFAAEQVSALYVFGTRDTLTPALLAGQDIGVLSAMGQTGFSVKQLLEQWGLQDQVRLVELGTYPKIYAELQAGRIAAGILTADYGIAGTATHGFTMLADVGTALQFQGPVVATTRRLIDKKPEVVQRIVDAYVETIRTFKQAPDIVVPILQHHLGFVDEKQARAIQAFYSQRFQDVPHASPTGLARILASMPNVPAGVDLSGVIDHRFVDHALSLPHAG